MAAADQFQIVFEYCAYLQPPISEQSQSNACRF